MPSEDTLAPFLESANAVLYKWEHLFSFLAYFQQQDPNFLAIALV